MEVNMTKIADKTLIVLFCFSKSLCSFYMHLFILI